MSNLSLVRNYCIGTAESEKAFIKDVFFDTGKYQDIIQVPPGSPILLIGKKGTGKSMLLNMLKLKTDAAEIQNLLLKPDNLENIDKADQYLDIANLKRIYFESLITTISIRMGESIRIYFNRKDKKLYDKAIASRAKDKSIIELGVRYLVNVGSVLSEKQYTALMPERPKDFSTAELKRSLDSALSKKIFWLFIDDTDQIAQLNSREQVNRIWALLLAIRQLCEDYQNIKCIITLRTEVWQVLKMDIKGQRDQVDHFKSLIRILDPDDSQIRDIVIKRIRFIENKLGILQHNGFSPLFEGDDIYLPKSEEKRYWDDFIVKSSRQRPRDSIQLIDILAKYSINRKYEIIKASVIEKALEEYANDRVEDLAMEFANDCTEVKQIVKTFAKCKFSMNIEEAKYHIKTIPSTFSVSIRGIPIRPDNNEGIILLWNFIHEIGFLNPCIRDDRMPKGFRHIMYSENPNFVSVSNLNEMREAVWEIHPAYRSFLLKEIEDQKAKKSIGLNDFFQAKKATIVSSIFEYLN